MTVRARRATIALGLILLRPVAACHAYAPVTGATPVAGTRVKVRFAEPRTLTLHLAGGQPVVRNAVREVTGTLGAVNGDTAHLTALGVVYGVSASGPALSEYDYRAANVDVPLVGSTIKVEQFSLWRTAVVAGIGAAALVVAIAALASGGGGSPSTY